MGLLSVAEEQPQVVDDTRMDESGLCVVIHHNHIRSEPQQHGQEDVELEEVISSWAPLQPVSIVIVAATSGGSQQSSFATSLASVHNAMNAGLESCSAESRHMLVAESTWRLDAQSAESHQALRSDSVVSGFILRRASGESVIVPRLLSLASLGRDSIVSHVKVVDDFPSPSSLPSLSACPDPMHPIHPGACNIQVLLWEVYESFAAGGEGEDGLRSSPAPATLPFMTFATPPYAPAVYAAVSCNLDSTLGFTYSFYSSISAWVWHLVFRISTIFIAVGEAWNSTEMGRFMISELQRVPGMRLHFLPSPLASAEPTLAQVGRLFAAFLDDDLPDGALLMPMDVEYLPLDANLFMPSSDGDITVFNSRQLGLMSFFDKREKSENQGAGHEDELYRMYPLVTTTMRVDQFRRVMSNVLGDDLKRGDGTVARMSWSETILELLHRLYGYDPTVEAVPGDRKWWNMDQKLMSWALQISDLGVVERPMPQWPEKGWNWRLDRGMWPLGAVSRQTLMGKADSQICRPGHSPQNLEKLMQVLRILGQREGAEQLLGEVEGYVSRFMQPFQREVDRQGGYLLARQ
jgi:hypothetical protein